MRPCVGTLVRFCLLAATLGGLGGCGGSPQGGGDGHGGRPGGGPGAGGGRPPAEGSAMVPVEVARAVRTSISSYIETNGTLEAENEVDIVARTVAPVIELRVEEGDQVRAGQVLARLDATEHRAQLEIARVALSEAKLAYGRAETLKAENLLSPEAHEQAQSALEAAQAQFDARQIQLDYTTITAPFDGLIIARYVKMAQQVNVNTPLYRLSDFEPLLAPVQVPERELPRLHLGQRAYLTVEPYPGERFAASVLRLSPVIAASSGTIKVTLQVDPRGLLRPGMFARVYVETDSRNDALVIPKKALSMESIGDTVFIAGDGVAARREVALGFEEGDFVEVVSGVEEGEAVVVVGQDGLSDGTPIRILEAAPAAR